MNLTFVEFSCPPSRKVAQLMVTAAIASGELKKKPCCICGSTGRVEAHHEDYSKPNVIAWLCPKDHRERHKELGWGLPGPPPKRSDWPPSSMTLSDLMEKAKAASPAAKDCGQQWRRLWPAYAILRERKLTCNQAVQWLIAEGEIKKADAPKALQAFHRIATRKNRKAKSE